MIKVEVNWQHVQIHVDAEKAQMDTEILVAISELIKFVEKNNKGNPAITPFVVYEAIRMSMKDSASERSITQL